MRSVFEYESTIARPASEVFAFHKRPDALQLLIPPGEPIRILEHTGGIENGARVVLQMGYWPLAIRWVARHQGYMEGRQFQDVQERGPFKLWEHTHRVVPVADCCCKLIDHIEYELPFGRLGALGRRLVERKLQQTFEYRHRITRQSL